ncbi:MAG: type II toxin-antitoxin system RelE/ParE family toxin [Planctomycetes bacterium]|nr:type II toxin-antitoxin system RelE/ParE family toxin [Planctomycetota bacterium]
MPLSIQIVPSALEELKAVKVFCRWQVAAAIERELQYEPILESENRKQLLDPMPSFECEPPVWELRVGHYCVFYDVDEESRIVLVRAIRLKPPSRTTEEMQ